MALDVESVVVGGEEVLLTDYPTPLLKEPDTATDLYLFHPEAPG